MKKILLLFLCTILLGNLFVFAQNQNQTERLLHKKELIYVEGGINMSLPVHIQMYRSHRLAIGINLRAAKPISSKTELGVRFEFDYRFIKKNSRNLTPESTLEERALHSNFSLITIKPNFQFNWNSHWFLGAETGIGYQFRMKTQKSVWVSSPNMIAANNLVRALVCILEGILPLKIKTRN